MATLQVRGEAFAERGSKEYIMTEQQEVLRLGDVFEVTGGRESGGIRVRQGRSIASAEGARLMTGSHVRALEYDAGRLHYELIDGEGPAQGWVSLRVNGKDLLVNISDDGSTESGSGQQSSSEPEAASEALCCYGSRLAAARLASKALQRGGFDGRASFPLSAKRGKDAISVSSINLLCEQHTTDKDTDVALEASTEGEGNIVLCQQCNLPMGQVAYSAGYKTKAIMHGECMAQHMLQSMRDEEDSRKAKVQSVKQSRREEYDIGWNTEVVPSNEQLASKLGCTVLRNGLCCLAMDDEDRIVVCPTLEPGAAINLEYLSIALQVRRQEGREPLFSLDPVDEFRSLDAPEGSMQVKRFEPEWLAGTSLGEVLFQADYHLKELSMGEYEQPVLGMKSCFDISKDGDCEHEWAAREWFVMRQAEVHVSEDNVIIPFLKMGVEAREQFIGEDGLEDAPLTRPDHPLVKYAEDFTQNFDLIAERKSVIFQLREVAKAAVLAKFMLESGARFEEMWFDLAGSLDAACCLEVPQLWNDTWSSQVSVRDGTIQEAESKKAAVQQRGVYGGVDFGIDRFRLSVPSRIATSVVSGRISIGAPGASLLASSRQRLSLGPYSLQQLATPLAAPQAAATRAAPSIGVPQRLAAPMFATSLSAGLRAPSGALSMAAGLRAPQGVDLSLEQFNLSAPTMAGGEVRSKDPEGVVGQAFWASLGAEGPSGLAKEDKALLCDVFNPHLSDRREEGEAFVPPPTGPAYLQGLKELLASEDAVRHMRREHFLGKSFSEEDAGPLFPSSWTSTFQGDAASGRPQGEMLHARTDVKTDPAVLTALHQALRSAPPAFDRCAEDGARFRIYRRGSLEVRTIQEVGEQEYIGAVYSVRSAMTAWGGKFNRKAGDNERLSKATEYIEQALDGTSGYNLFIVLETDEGHSIVTEKLHDGLATWQENHQDLDDRLSLAKVVRTADCTTAGSTVLGIKAYQMRETRLLSKQAVSPAKRDQYAQVVFGRATGRASGYTSGFMRKQDLQRNPRRGGKATGKGGKGAGDEASKEL